MDILAKITEKEEQFEALKAAILQREEVIKTMNTEIISLADDMKRVQGAHSTLVELGKEMGILDAEGQPVNTAAPQKNHPIEVPFEEVKTEE